MNKYPKNLKIYSNHSFRHRRQLVLKYLRINCGFLGFHKKNSDIQKTINTGKIRLSDHQIIQRTKMLQLYKNLIFFEIFQLISVVNYIQLYTTSLFDGYYYQIIIQQAHTTDKNHSLKSLLDRHCKCC